MAKLNSLLSARERLQREYNDKYSELVALDEAIKGLASLINQEMQAQQAENEKKLLELA